MCGINGYILLNETYEPNGRKLIEMNRLIAHRGPDDEGFFTYNTTTKESLIFAGEDSHKEIKTQQSIINTTRAIVHNVALAHRRYSIIDLSAKGHQPMLEDNLILTFNGEIYNYIELKRTLLERGHTFRTDSDTEVLIKAYKEWGVECFKQFKGMFALAIYDTDKEELILARDHIGKAPLYFTQTESSFAFSSEIKPLLLLYPDNYTKLNDIAVSDYLFYGIRDFGNQTFWRAINTLDASSYLIVGKCGTIKQTKYWTFPTERLSTKDISFPEASNTFFSLLQNALSVRLRSDIPIGFTLSGGLDSSALVALYATSSDSSYKTPCFTIGFPSEHWNEVPFAQKVVKLYADKLEHIVIGGFSNTLLDDIDSFFGLIEEPFHSPNIYTDNYLQKLLKNRGIGININGAAGDELLAGYDGKQYKLAYLNYLWKYSKKDFFTQLPYLFRSEKGVFEKVAGYFYRKTNLESIQDSILNFSSPLRVIKESNDFNERIIQNFSNYKMNYWLRSGNSHYMTVPVEPRTPFLDIDLINFSLRLPPTYLINGGWQKYILRKSMEKILPPEVTWRKYKLGFPFDLTLWLTVNKTSLVKLFLDVNDPYIDTIRLVSQYDTINKHNSSLLWRLICLKLWYKKTVMQTTLSL